MKNNDSKVFRSWFRRGDAYWRRELMSRGFSDRQALDIRKIMYARCHNAFEKGVKHGADYTRDLALDDNLDRGSP